MFTGIVEELAAITSVDDQSGGRELRVKTRFASELQEGHSIALNGCCVTVTAPDSDSFGAHLMPETLGRTNLGDVQPGDRINIERTVRNDGRFDGHIVQGHIDDVAAITKIEPLPDGSARMEFEIPETLIRYIVPKGSVALDGVSLTVVDSEQGQCAVALIPHTLAVTTLGFKHVGDRLNVEVDVLAKYVERLIQKRDET